MKRLAFILIFSLIALGCLAAFDSKDWEWKASIQAEQGSTGFVRLNLPFWVFEKSQPSLADIRLIDKSGELVPHVLYWGRSKTRQKISWHPVRLLNPTYQPNEYTRVVLDFGEPVEKNILKVITDGENFRRRVMIEGGADSQNWERIVENLYLFDIRQNNVTFKAEELRFASNNFRYIRLTVYNMPDDPRRIEIKSAESARESQEAEELAKVPIQSAQISQDEDNKETILEFDLAVPNIPVTRIKLDIAEPYFHRAFILEGRNSITMKRKRQTETGWDEKEEETPWSWIAQGVLYRFLDNDKSSESVTIQNFQAQYRYLRIRIINKDNPAIALIKNKWEIWQPQVSLVFKRREGEACFLITGNPKATAPQYDLEQSVANIKETSFPLVQIGQPQPLKHTPDQIPWTERHRALMWLALIGAVVVAGALMFNSLRSLKTPPQA